ncbi:polymer-forming cytoskeletal protein [Lutimonas halocynthiae]|jgi:cytoskeletal protein CcmA (bactofilin family)|uniref:bactofilin family protein n=1 Tax=Lutimonas halocynthiae TaxID=1446477 RepID=UPI0025B2BF36|nr:polymer-forming cytoskeletal protein [Lutimonas halocynthiae]MDN3641941.1 polymer-forming cytoskeletal protein [Lutimonas halocynthiae]
MFNEKKENPNPVGERNIIAKNSSLVGDIKSDGDFRVDGKIEGTIQTSGRVVIGKEGYVSGTIDCTNADIEGTFSGKLIVDQILSLKSTADISGDVVMGKLSVEPGAVFNATCAMKSAVKVIQNGAEKTKKTA